MRLTELPFLEKLEEIRLLTSDYKEDWANITLKGNYNPMIFSLYRETHTILAGLGREPLIHFKFDDAKVGVDEMDDYEQRPDSFFKCELSFNKQGNFERNLQAGSCHHCFLTAAACAAWLAGLNPLDSRNPVNLHAELYIIVLDIDRPLGSSTFQLLPPGAVPLTDMDPLSLPSFERLQENIHFISEIPVDFRLASYALLPAEYDNELGKPLLKLAEIALSVTVADEFYSFKKVILNGLRRLVLPVGEKNHPCEYKQIARLINLVTWLYEDRVSTRKKLFNERLTLEIDESSNLVEALRRQLPPALEQAKERYLFVILDRKDAYVKELKELLKDLRTQSDLYAGKIRTLLSNFLRDVLATLVLIGFTIFTKFTDNLGLDKHKLLPYVFDGLAVYLLVSIAFQSIVDVTDLVVTTKELTYWKKASKELISEKEFNQHYQYSLKSRKISVCILYPLIALLYLIIANLCLQYPAFFEKLMTGK